MPAVLQGACGKAVCVLQVTVWCCNEVEVVLTAAGYAAY